MRATALGIVLCAALGAPRAAGAEEHELVLALEPAFAVAHLGSRTAWGGGGGADIQYGITDALALRLTGAYSRHDLPAGDKGVPGGTLTAFHAGAGLSYAVDIVRLVPYFDLSVGLLGMTAPPLKPGQSAFSNTSGCATPDTSTILCFGVEIGVGVDYLLTRRVAIGVVVRYHAFVSNLNDIPIYLYAGPRVAIHFGG